jgi:hypothetical protein
MLTRPRAWLRIRRWLVPGFLISQHLVARCDDQEYPEPSGSPDVIIVMKRCC